MGKALRDPVKQYSSGMRARLAFGLSLAIRLLSDRRIRRRPLPANAKRACLRARAPRLMASHDVQMIANYCDRALIIESGRAKIFHDIQEAVEVYTWLRAA
ncbi:ABC transporter ATP-binding protein [Brevundimonas naejangsanensis]|uniref:ABC transporter ATP-binding protein n=1 Tax=Brevundimonas naejangsanensis TaxID=588932 RepID=UPI001F3E7A35|nr:ABC transporter ATP-binding protein [Brevundimonas naejangsanensis]